jgi:hypothetical protein
LGWSIVPVDGKTPRLNWKKPPSWDRMERLWDDPKTTGLAVILGEPSNNLIARDFDRLDAYEQWRDANGDLASVLPTSITARGRHVFARTAGPCPIQRFDDGELRGDGAIVVLPPSRHPNGGYYAWSREPSLEIPIVECNILIGAAKPKQRRGASPSRTAPEISDHASEKNGGISRISESPHLTHAADLTHAPDKVPPHIACVNCYVESVMRDAIERTLPTRYGQRNRRIFDFARELRMLFAESTDVESLRPFVEDWHRAALPNIRTKDFWITWQDFVLAWASVRVPARALLATIKSVASADPFTLGRGDSNLDKVARLFRAAAQVHGPANTFYMSYRVIGANVCLSPVASRSIALRLVAQDLLVIVKKGTVGTRGRATEWRWLGG